MTDEEIGSAGELPWDGVSGPMVVESDGTEAVDYASFDHVDYVRSALDNRFTLAVTGRVDTRPTKRGSSPEINPRSRCEASINVGLRGTTARSWRSRAHPRW